MSHYRRTLLRPRFWRAFLLALLVLAAPQVASAQNIDQLFRDYNAQMNAGSYAEAVRTAQRMADIAPTQNWQAASLNALGRALNNQGRYEDATPVLEKALAIQLDDTNSNRGWIPNNLGHNLRKRKQFDRAEKMFQQAQAEFERMYGAKSEQVATVRSNLGWVYYDQKKFDQAAKVQTEVLALVRELFGDDDATVGKSYNELGMAQIGQGKFAESQKNLEKALDITRRAQGDESPDVAIMLDNLADLHRKQKHWADAEKFARQSLAIREKLFGHNSPIVAEQLTDIAGDLKEQGNGEDAQKLLDDAAAIEKALAEAKDPADNPFRVGQTVVVKAERTNIMDGAAAIGYVLKGMEFEIHSISGRWCGVKINVLGEVKSGWLDSDDATLALVGTGRLQPVELKYELIAADGEFRILMPRQPTLTRQKENGIEHSAYALDTPQARFVAAWFDVPEGSTLTFDAAQMAFAAARDGKIESEDRIALEDEYAGRDSLIRLPAGDYCRMRLFGVKSRYYQLILEGPKELVSSKQADAYFDSFQRR